MIRPAAALTRPPQAVEVRKIRSEPGRAVARLSHQPFAAQQSPLALCRLRDESTVPSQSECQDQEKDSEQQSVGPDPQHYG